MLGSSHFSFSCWARCLKIESDSWSFFLPKNYCNWSSCITPNIASEILEKWPTWIKKNRETKRIFVLAAAFVDNFKKLGFQFEEQLEIASADEKVIVIPWKWFNRHFIILFWKKKVMCIGIFYFKRKNIKNRNHIEQFQIFCFTKSVK